MKTVLRPLFFLLLLMACKISAQGDGEHTDTVYPEVWDWQAEQYKMDNAFLIRSFALEDGDVLINFSWMDESNEETNLRQENFTFFGGQTFESLAEAFTILERSDGSSYDVSLLPNGKRVDNKLPSSPCERNFTSYLSIYDRANSEYWVDKTAFLFLPNTPFVYPDVSCEWGTDPLFTHNVAVFSPTDVIPLRDNTFLVADERLGTIVRFDENLESYSALIGTSLFAVDHEDFYEFIRRFLNEDDPLKLRNSWGYGWNYPVILDELEKMIKQLVSRSEWLLEIENKRGR